MGRLSIAIAAFLVSAALVTGASSLLVENSPYAGDVNVERAPYAPDRPANLTGETAGAYASAYEEIRLGNDLYATRGHVLDEGERAIARCRPASVADDGPDRYRVELQCTGRIDDVYRLFEPEPVDYRVTYRVSEDTSEQVSIRGYPYGERAGLRPRSTRPA